MEVWSSKLKHCQFTQHILDKLMRSCNFHGPMEHGETLILVAALRLQAHMAYVYQQRRADLC